MKGKFILSAILLAATTLLISCEKQGQQEVDPITGECTFTDNLTLTINGRTIKGCTAVYTPGSGNATISIFGATVDIDKVTSEILPTYQGSGRDFLEHRTVHQQLARYDHPRLVLLKEACRKPL